MQAVFLRACVAVQALNNNSSVCLGCQLLALLFNLLKQCQQQVPLGWCLQDRYNPGLLGRRGCCGAVTACFGGLCSPPINRRCCIAGTCSSRGSSTAAFLAALGRPLGLLLWRLLRIWTLICWKDSPVYPSPGLEHTQFHTEERQNTDCACGDKYIALPGAAVAGKNAQDRRPWGLAGTCMAWRPSPVLRTALNSSCWPSGMRPMASLDRLAGNRAAALAPETAKPLPEAGPHAVLCSKAAGWLLPSK